MANRFLTYRLYEYVVVCTVFVFIGNIHRCCGGQISSLRSRFSTTPAISSSSRSIDEMLHEPNSTQPLLTEPTPRYQSIVDRAQLGPSLVWPISMSRATASAHETVKRVPHHAHTFSLLPHFTHPKSGHTSDPSSTSHQPFWGSIDTCHQECHTDRSHF